MTNEDGMTEVTFDPTKPVQTRGGLKAKIYRTDLDMSTGETILAVVTDELGNDSALFFYPNGMYLQSNEHHLDLINVPEKITMENDEAEMQRLMDEKDRLMAEAQRIMGLQGKIIASLTEDNHMLRKKLRFKV